MTNSKQNNANRSVRIFQNRNINIDKEIYVIHLNTHFNYYVTLNTFIRRNRIVYNLVIEDIKNLYHV